MKRARNKACAIAWRAMKQGQSLRLKTATSELIRYRSQQKKCEISARNESLHAIYGGVFAPNASEDAMMQEENVLDGVGACTPLLYHILQVCLDQVTAKAFPS